MSLRDFDGSCSARQGDVGSMQLGQCQMGFGVINTDWNQ